MDFVPQSQRKETVLITAQFGTLTQWDNVSFLSYAYQYETFDHIQVSHDGSFVVGYHSANDGYYTGITIVDIDSLAIDYVLTSKYTPIPTLSRVFSLCSRNHTIVYVTEFREVIILENATDSDSANVGIIVLCVAIALLPVLLCCWLVRRKALRMK